MRLRFIGLNGSMGLHFGQVYRVTVHPWKNGVRLTSPVICPYDSEKAFWQNWAHPDEDLRKIMEAKGSELRRIHINHGRQSGKSEVLEHLASGLSDGAQREDRADEGLGSDGAARYSAEAGSILDHDGAAWARYNEKSERPGHFV